MSNSQIVCVILKKIPHLDFDRVIRFARSSSDFGLPHAIASVKKKDKQTYTKHLQQFFSKAYRRIIMILSPGKGVFISSPESSKAKMFIKLTEITTW